MQELHELEMQLIQIDNQLYDILIDNSINNNVSLDNNKLQQCAINRQYVANYDKTLSTDNSYLNRYTSIKDPRIMKMRTYNVSDSDEIEYISKVYDMR